MDDILGDIINNNIKVIIEEKKIICYSTKNTIVTKTLSEISGLILDICGIISEYYNAVIIITNIHKRVPIYLLFKNQYINFKKINQGIRMHSYYYPNDWYVKDILVENSTILASILCGGVYSLETFNVYLEKKYKIDGFLNTFYQSTYRSDKFIYNNEILINKEKDEYNITILDHELFVFLIIIIKKIIEKLNEKN